MFLSPTQAVKKYDVSKPTLYADMKGGKLSYKTDDRGKRKINVAELDRVYEKRANTPDVNPALEDVKHTHNLTSSSTNEAALVEVKYLKEMLNQQKEQFENEIDNLRSSLRLAQEGQNKVTLLLEKQDGGGGEVEKLLNSLEERIAKQEEAANHNREKTETLEQEKKKLTQALKQQKAALEQERNKGFWRRVFG